MGSLRHLFYWLAISCAAGAVIATAAKTWDWSRGVTFGVALAAVAIIGTLATREALFAPGPPHAKRPHRRS